MDVLVHFHVDYYQMEQVLLQLKNSFVTLRREREGLGGGGGAVILSVVNDLYPVIILAFV